jgi:RimJ/RimL family protein N-acetyltransferase
MKPVQVELRPPLQSDLPFIRWLWGDPETMDAVGGPVELTEEQAVRWFAAMVDPGSPTDRYRLIFDAADRPVGEISFHRLQPDTMTAELNVKIASPYRRRGYARRAMLQFLDDFFHDAGGRVLVDDVAPENVAGQQALLSFGFDRDVGEQGVVRLRMTRETYDALYPEGGRP